MLKYISFSIYFRYTDSKTTCRLHINVKATRTQTHVYTSSSERYARGMWLTGNFNWLPAAGCVSAAYLSVCTLTASDDQLIRGTKGQLYWDVCSPEKLDTRCTIFWIKKLTQGLCNSLCRARNSTGPQNFILKRWAAPQESIIFSLFTYSAKNMS